MGSFGIPLSGLIASQDALSTVSNNLANLDTVGYKDQSVSFNDIFAQSSATNGANDPIQTGLGVELSQTSSNFTAGSPTATGVPSNMALSGNGFFIVQQSNGSTAYSRAGDFTTNSTGQLVTPSGALVMGYPAVNGVVSTTSPLQALNVGSGAAIPATATSSFNITSNLDSNAPVNGAYNATPVQVYDSLGNSHNVTVDFTKTGANTWSYSVNVPTADTGLTTTQVASGSLTFNSSGQLTSSTNAAGVTTPPGNVPVTIPITGGAANITLNWDLNGSTGSPSITQTAIVSTSGTTTQYGSTSSNTADGSASGTLVKYAVQTNGTIEASFSNGQTQALGQVAVATFTNQQGLQQASNNLFQETAGSGAAQVNVAGTGGAGTISGGSVEGSNVDVASEFANMIVAQQAYQANAKTVTTMDHLSQAIIQMVS